MNRYSTKTKGIAGWTVVELWNGIIVRTELPLYKTRDIAVNEALREIHHRMLNDHPDGLEEDDKRIYTDAQKDISDGIQSVLLPNIGDGNWEIVIRPIKKSVL